MVKILGILLTTKEFRKLFLLDKIASTQKATSIDIDEFMKNDDERARVLNIFFSNIVTNLQIPSLREKCPNTELFLVCIFLYSD